MLWRRRGARHKTGAVIPARELPEDARTRIIRSARKSFASLGFTGASTRQIAEEAGVAQSLLLYHYKSKERLWRTVMENSFQRALRILNDAAIAEPSDQPTAQLMAGVRALIDIFASDADFYRLLNYESRDPGQRMVWLIDTYLRPMAERAARFIKAAQAEGTVTAGDPFLIYYMLVGQIGSVYSLSGEMEMESGGKRPRKDEVETLVRRFLLLESA